MIEFQIKLWRESDRKRGEKWKRTKLQEREDVKLITCVYGRQRDGLKGDFFKSVINLHIGIFLQTCFCCTITQNVDITRPKSNKCGLFLRLQPITLTARGCSGSSGSWWLVMCPSRTSNCPDILKYVRLWSSFSSCRFISTLCGDICWSPYMLPHSI